VRCCRRVGPSGVYNGTRNRTWCRVHCIPTFDDETIVGGRSGFESPCPNDPSQRFFFLNLSNFNFFDATVRFGNEDVRCAWWRWIITDLPDNPEIECCRAPTISKLVNECGGLGRDRRNQPWFTVHNLPSFRLYDKVIGGSLGFDSPCPNGFSLPWIFSFYFPEHLFCINFGHT
jgi:hypothetical protein